MPKNLSLWFGYAVAMFAVLSGGGGMCLSLMQMSCAETNDIIAGSVLVGAGVIGLAVLSLAMALTAGRETPARDSEV